MNKTVLMGRLSKDPEMRETNNGTSVTHFVVASNENIKTKDGYENKATFIDIVAWAGLGEFVNNNFVKGKPIYVEGSLFNDKWTDKDGNNRSFLRLRASKVSFVPTDNTRTERTSSEVESTEKVAAGTDDNMPF